MKRLNRAEIRRLSCYSANIWTQEPASFKFTHYVNMTGVHCSVTLNWASFVRHVTDESLITPTGQSPSGGLVLIFLESNKLKAKAVLECYYESWFFFLLSILRYLSIYILRHFICLLQLLIPLFLSDSWSYCLLF